MACKHACMHPHFMTWNLYCTFEHYKTWWESNICLVCRSNITWSLVYQFIILCTQLGLRRRVAGPRRQTLTYLSTLLLKPSSALANMPSSGLASMNPRCVLQYLMQSDCNNMLWSECLWQSVPATVKCICFCWVFDQVKLHSSKMSLYLPLLSLLLWKHFLPITIIMHQCCQPIFDHVLENSNRLVTIRHIVLIGLWHNNSLGV